MGTPEEPSTAASLPSPTKDGNKVCEMCKKDPSKYTCPRCQIKTCCLSCVKNHKAQNGCSGVRNKTAYVPIKEFTESDLISDYRLLEDIDRKRYAACGDIKSKPGYLNFRWKLVSRKAAESGVRLRLLPHFFSKHKENTTTFIKRFKVLAWHVKWIFAQSNAEFTNVRLREDVILREALNKYLHPDEADPVIRHRLKKYCVKGLTDIKVYMKIEDKPANTVRYHSMDLDKTLGKNLRGKIVVEYPTFHVALPDQADQYHLLEQDAGGQLRVEVQNNVQTGDQIKQKQGKGTDLSEETKSHQTDFTNSHSLSLMDHEREDGEIIDDDLEEDS